MLDLVAGQAEGEGHAAAVEILQAGGRVDGQGVDLLGRVMGHVLDVHAAFGRADDGDAAGFPVDQQREVKLARDVAAVLDVDAVDLLARRAGLHGDKGAAQHLAGEFGGFLHRFRQAHAALLARFGLLELALAAAAGVDLRLDHPERSVQFPGGGLRLFGAQHDAAVGDRNAVAAAEAPWPGIRGCS
ncbi:hypothetical protein MASR1M65_04130 [Saprospiraceae bacterium]